MSSIKSTKIDGSVSVGRNVAIGGSAIVQGHGHFKSNLKVDGWLEAKNIRDTGKGIFTSIEKLHAAYPIPRNGWWAIVGNTLPGPIYVGEDGKWIPTGETGGDPSIDIAQYNDDISTLNDDVRDLGTTISGFETTISDNKKALESLQTFAEGMFSSIDFSEIDTLYPANEKESMREFFGNGKVGYIVHAKNKPLLRMGYMYVMLNQTATFCTQIFLTNQKFDEDTGEMRTDLSIVGDFNMLTRWRYLRNENAEWSKWQYASAKLYDALNAQYRRMGSIENAITTLSERIEGIDSGNTGTPGAGEKMTWYILE